MSRDKKRHGILNGRIAYHVINSGWTGNLLAILNHTSDMKAQGFCRSAPRFFQISTSRNTPRKIWEAHAKIRFTILMQISDVIHQSPLPNACLLFDASQRANRYISNRMWHSDPSWLHRMLELLVAPNMRNLIPAVLLQAPYDFSAGHKTRYTLSTHLSSRGLQERPSGAIGWLGLSFQACKNSPMAGRVACLGRGPSAHWQGKG